MRALTPEQEEAAARRRGPLLLAAGAGSGKTSVLVERFVRAVREDGILPGRILAITFTERAAAELRARVRARLLELGEREAARDTEGAPIGTFHGFCARLLRIHALTARLDPEFSILEEAGAGRLRMLAFRHALTALLAGERRAGAIDLLAAYGADRLRGMVLGVYAELRSRGASVPVLPRPQLAEPPQPEAIRACALLGTVLEDFGRFYAELKRARAALDFDDLELCARDLLEGHEGVRRAWAERTELLMVDEFQDTNRRQLALLELLERENLFTVGDELQSIYGFRHAEVEIFRERRRRLQGAGAAIALAHNFRSRPPLIAAVNSVFGERFGSAYVPLVAARGGGNGGGGTPTDEAAARLGGESSGGGEPVSRDAGGPLIELLLTDRGAWSARTLAGQPLAREVAGTLPAGTLWRQAEARLLAQRVAELLDAGQATAGDVAVLLRSAGDLPLYERALEERGLRTLAATGSFWGHQQVGDLLAWLRALANPLDELALYSALASPLVGISSDGLALLALQARTEGAGAWATIARGEGALHTLMVSPDDERLARFAERFTAERDAARTHGPAELLLRAIAHSGYERHVLCLPAGDRRMANVHKLLRLARRFEALEGRELRDFLDHVEHRGAFDQAAEPHAPTGSEPDAVRLMTIHAAKGLEFPVVCLADLGRTLNGNPPDLLVDGERIGLRLASLDGSPPVECLSYQELCEERRRRQEAEEERILYVAMTRARERLLLSGSCDFERWPARAGGASLAWLASALAPELPALARTLERPVTELAVGGQGSLGPDAGEEGLATVLCWLNSPATVGAVLRRESLGPAVRTVTRAGAPTAPAAGTGEPALAPTPAPPLSYTALSELERCGYRYYLERVLGLPENRAAGRGESPRRVGLRARPRGVLVHGLLESFDFAPGCAPSAERPTPQEVEAVARKLGIAVSARERAELASLVRAAASTPLAERLGRAQQVRHECPFAFVLPARGVLAGGTPGEELRAADTPVAGEPDGGQLVTGVLDLLAHEPEGGWLVVDYKSDRVAQEDDLEDLVQREYGVQRLLYALAALHGGAARVEVVHWFLERPGEWVGARFEAGERGELQDRLRARVADVNARGFAVSETPHRGLCLTCPGRARLCSWNEADTLRERPAAESGAAC